jgi:hypothetical protein
MPKPQILRRAHHKRIEDVLKGVDLVAWDSLRIGMGKRTRFAYRILAIIGINRAVASARVITPR